MSDRIYNVMFLCTGNSARSIMAESILRKDGRGRFKTFSAGSQPRGIVNAMALDVLASFDYPTDDMRSKSWDEFSGPQAPVMDFVFTVCDDAAGEVCPVWPGQPMTAHWGIDDPAAATGTSIEKERAFVRAFKLIKNRLSLFLSLPLASIDKMALGSKLKEIGDLRKPFGPLLLPAQNVIIYHNPDCGTSRNVLAMIRNAGIEPEIIEYVKTPPSLMRLVQLLEWSGLTPRQLLREKGTPYAELGLDNLALTDNDLLDAMLAHPILINRPLVVTPLGTKLCRPSELVLDILPAPQQAAFVKEDGETVVDDAGHRLA
jgi:arsenate reductase (glutaredoxin)